MAKTTAKRNSASPAKAVSKRWRDLFALLPRGYDPIKTAEPGDWFDEAAAERACQFFPEMLCHVEGALAGQPFVLEPWQQAVTGCVFGWKRKDYQKREVRRYRTVLLFVPRGNGKTPFAAGMCLYTLFCDGEAGAQIYSLATEAEQAALLYRHASGMVESNDLLASRSDIYSGMGHRSIVLKSDRRSVYKVINAAPRSKHGFMPHAVFVDELHQFDDREIMEAVWTAFAKLNRTQPLLVYMTTSDYERESVCNEVYEQGVRVLDGRSADSRFLPVIYEVPKDADWTDEASWAKANPNLDISVSREALRELCLRAQESPTLENSFRRYHLNQRTETDVRWLPINVWDECDAEIDWARLQNLPCYAGLDLSSRQDMTALVLAWPDTDGLIYLRGWCWVPRSTAIKAQRDRTETPYLTWASQGHLELTDGEAIDYELIRKRFNEIAGQYRVEEVAIDPWQAKQMLDWLSQDGYTAFEHRQGFASMALPCKQLTEAFLNRQIRHGDSPVMRWHFGNVCTEEDAAGNIKFNKRKSYGRIDSMVAAAMATGRAILHAGERRSAYEDGDLLVV